MKFNFHTIVFDIETTNEDDKCIIEIGATFLDKELHIIDHFQSLVFPSHPVTDFVVELTGHTREKLKEAPGFIDVAQKFEEWALKCSGNIKHCRLAAWGNYFDINVLRHDYWSYEREFPFSGTCIDIKTIGLAYCYLAGKRTDSLSVSKMAEYLGIIPHGQYHRADVDAFVTTKIYVECLKRIQGGVWIDSKYIKIGE